MHYGVVPITDDGRLSAKEVVGNKKALTAFQDRFNEHVKQRGYDLERGQSRQVTNAQHEQISQYKQKQNIISKNMNVRAKNRPYKAKER